MRLALGLCCVLAVLGAAASALLAQAGSGGQNLIVNGDFETGDPAPWVAVGGTLTVGGDHAGALAINFSSATVQQMIDEVVPGQTYRYTGLFVSSTGTILSVKPGAIIFEEGDQRPYDHSPLSAAGPWMLEFATSCAATGAVVRIAVTGDPGATVYLDDLKLEAIDPFTPCPTATPTVTDTPTFSATPSRTPTPSNTATPTRTSTPQAGQPSQTATAFASPTRTPTRAVTPTLTPANGLLINGGFEAADGDVPAAWEHFGGTLTRAGQPVRAGAAAACLQSATSSTKWLYQTVPIAPGAWYELSAYIYDDDPAVDAAWLRISWYESDDGSGSALWTVDSTEVLATAQAAYRLLTTGVVQAPPNARSASARILLRPTSSAPATICVDDASLTGAAPPPTATLTATPTATATPLAPAQIVPSATTTPTCTPAVLGATHVPTLTATWTRQPPAPSATPTPAPLYGLLVNGGFESGLDGWRTFGGALTQVASPVGSGQYAGAFAVQSGNTSWAYQTVAVAAGGWYDLSAYIYSGDANVEAAFLRLSWYASGDGSGSAIDSVDSTEVLDAPQPAFRALTTGPVQAPPGAHSAKARILLRPRAPGAAWICIDDVFFQPAAPLPAADGAPMAGEADQSAPSAGTARRASTGTTAPSQVLGAESVTGAAAPAAHPTPVIRRDGLLVPAEGPSPSRRPMPAWAWVLAGGAVAAFVAGAGTSWWEGRRQGTSPRAG